MPMAFRDLYTLASGISLARLVLAAAMPAFVGTPWLLPAYLAALASDVVDGAVARHTGTSSRAGAAFDGWVDKVLHVNLGWALAVADLVPDWYVAAWCAREIVQAPLVFVLIHRFRTAKVEAPRTSLLGRATAIFLALSVVLAVLGHAGAPAPDAFAALIGVLGASAGVHYGWRYLRARPVTGYGERAETLSA